MLPLSELVRFAETIDDDWRSPVADAAAGLWGLQRPVFVRSSASHVFVAGGPERRVVLRMRPDTLGAAAVLLRGARAADRWHRAGAPFVQPVPSTAGQLVETVDGYVVTALQVAEGEQLDGTPLGRPDVHGWGATLAALHAVDTQPDVIDLPTTEALLRVDGLPPDLQGAAESVLDGLAALPADAQVRGVLHGDPEPDNVIGTTAGPVLVDPDDVRVGWFASDVAFGLRDWQDAEGRLDWELDVPAWFLEGYRSVRPLTDEELATVPLLVRAAALEDLAALQPHLRERVAEGWPDWAVDLHAKVRSRAVDLHRIATGPAE